MDDTSSIIESLKRRALQMLGVTHYNVSGADAPSMAVDAAYSEVLREFLSVFPWSWAAVASEPPPPSDQVLVWHWQREGEYHYTPTSVQTIPSSQPDCQAAFCYALAARVALTVSGDMRTLQLMEAQAERWLSEARYKEAYEVCLRGDGAMTNFYKRKKEGSGYDYS